MHQSQPKCHQLLMFLLGGAFLSHYFINDYFFNIVTYVFHFNQFCYMKWPLVWHRSVQCDLIHILRNSCSILCDAQVCCKHVQNLLWSIEIFSYCSLWKWENHKPKKMYILFICSFPPVMYLSSLCLSLSLSPRQQIFFLA